jgi:hypothetical protein
MRQIFYVDSAMCGGEELPADFDLENFRAVLQSNRTSGSSIARSAVGRFSTPANSRIWPTTRSLTSSKT